MTAPGAERPTRWRTASVFICSTFRDMQAERTHLVKVVMPRLRQRLERHRVHLVDVDLRWGVTRKQAENDGALDVCLEWVRACRPLFLGVLGHRYGWIPDRVSAETAREHAIETPAAGRSITEIEILVGALESEWPSRALFALRSDEALVTIPEAERGRIYLDPEPASAVKLERLKRRIREAGLPLVDGYACRWDPEALERTTRRQGRLSDLDAFGDDLEGLLWGAIVEELSLSEDHEPGAEADAGDWLAEEDEEQERFMELRRHGRRGRDEVYRALLEIAGRPSDKVCWVRGPTGIGKSTELAHLVDALRRERPEWSIVPHFVGAGRRSSSAAGMLQRLCLHLAHLFGLQVEIPNDLASLATTFAETLGRVPANRHLVVVLDGLDQLDDIGAARELGWLPARLPGPLRLFASCADAPPDRSKAFDALAGRPHEELQIGWLERSEQLEILRALPSLAAKTLDDRQQELLLDRPAARNPLYLQVALEELRGVGSFERLDQRIASFPEGKRPLLALFDQVFNRLEEEFGRELVRRTLSALRCSRRGLSERELVSLTAELDDAEELFPLLMQLREYCFKRGPLVDFHHRAVGEAVAERYLADDSARRAAHRRLADHFSEKARLGRQSEELLWQFEALEDWPLVYLVLTDPDLLRAIWDREPMEVFESWACVERNTPLRVVDAYERALTSGVVRSDLASMLVDLLSVMGHSEQAIPLQQAVVAFLRERPLELSFALRRLARLHESQGEYAEALERLDDAERTVADRSAEELIEILSTRAAVLAGMGRYREALEACLQAEDLAEGGVAGDTVRAGVLLAKTTALKGCDRREEALQAVRSALELFRRQGQELLAAGGLNIEAQLLRDLGRLGEAWDRHEAQQEIGERLGARQVVALASAGKGQIARRRGDPEQAEALHAKAERLYRKIGDQTGQARSVSRRAWLRLEAEEFEPALRMFEEQESLSRPIHYRRGLASALEGQGLALVRLDRHDEAFEKLDEAGRLYREMGDAAAVAKWVDHQAIALRLAGRAEQALELLRAAETGLRQAGQPYSLAINLANQASLLWQGLGDEEAAAPLVEEVRSLAERHGYGELTAKLDELVGEDEG